MAKKSDKAEAIQNMIFDASVALGRPEGSLTSSQGEDIIMETAEQINGSEDILEGVRLALYLLNNGGAVPNWSAMRGSLDRKLQTKASAADALKAAGFKLAVETSE